MRSVGDIHAELGGRRGEYQQPQAQRPRRGNSGPKFVERKTPAPLASHWASDAAQAWMDRARAEGFDPPYNENYLARDLEKVVAADPRMKRLRAKGREDDVHRWVAKMVELFWKMDSSDGFTYVRAGDSSSRIKDIFLVEVWDDLRDYAYDSLRARYLKEHGRVVEYPDYGNQAETEMHTALEAVRLNAYLERALAPLEDQVLRRLDEKAREGLLSINQKRSNS